MKILILKKERIITTSLPNDIYGDFITVVFDYEDLCCIELNNCNFSNNTYKNKITEGHEHNLILNNSSF